MSGSTLRIGVLAKATGEVLGTMTDVVGTLCLLNIGRPNCCVVGGSNPRPLRNCTNVKNSVTSQRGRGNRTTNIMLMKN